MNFIDTPNQEVRIQPLEQEDKDWFFKLATESDGSSWWYGPQCGEPMPSRSKFFTDFSDEYFNDEDQLAGRCFAIIHNSKKIGQVSYGKVDLEEKKSEIDIIIGDEENMGRGLGTLALELLIDYLNSISEVEVIELEVMASNERAISSYKKLGFERMDHFLKNNVEWITMEKSTGSMF